MASVARPVSSAGPPPPGGDPGERLVNAIAAQIDRMEAVLKQPAIPVLTDKQVDDIGARVALGCKTWSGALVRAANRQHYAMLLAALLVAALAGAAASWVAFGMPIHPSCAVTEAGGRLCGVWVVPDKAK